MSSNTVNNAENALKIQDTSGTTINGNTLIFSRAQSLLITQESSSAVRNNTLSSNTLLQKNIDYPYIEIRDNIAGTGIVAIG